MNWYERACTEAAFGGLPSMKARDFIKALQSMGFIQYRQTGSHQIWKHPDGRTATVPFVRPGKQIHPGLANKIIRKDLQVTPQQFQGFL